ncbi:unnamed protein product [Mesocestoides corti]|uniref:Uncharacterized protein n=1 Tax=Mesocestoides corti TaxID=53468 RepID=A0A0R3U6M8_MESCO|nr:unnamed protein product [Mesocestoides corti]
MRLRSHTRLQQPPEAHPPVLRAAARPLARLRGPQATGPSASSASSVSCISFGMFDSVSPHNPGQLFCPEGMPVSRAVGYSPSFYCYGCGRNMTTGSSLSSVAGSPPESLVGSRQRPKVCYSFTRSVEFYRSTRATRRAYVCPGVRRSLSYQSHATETRRRQSSSPITHRPMLTAEPVCRASKVLRRQSVKPRCRRRRQRRTTEAVSTSAAASRMPFWSSTPMPLSSSDALQTGRSDREKRFRRIFHKRLGQQRVADWLQTSQNFQSNALLSVF